MLKLAAQDDDDMSTSSLGTKVIYSHAGSHGVDQASAGSGGLGQSQSCSKGSAWVWQRQTMRNAQSSLSLPPGSPQPTIQVWA